jgi:hypothetical protein
MGTSPGSSSRPDPGRRTCPGYAAAESAATVQAARAPWDAAARSVRLPYSGITLSDEGGPGERTRTRRYVRLRKAGVRRVDARRMSGSGRGHIQSSEGQRRCPGRSWLTRECLPSGRKICQSDGAVRVTGLRPRAAGVRLAALRSAPLQAGGVVARYLVLFGLTSETAKQFLARTSDRAAAIREVAESAGGSLESYCWSWGNTTARQSWTCRHRQLHLRAGRPSSPQHPHSMDLVDHELHLLALLNYT